MAELGSSKKKSRKGQANEREKDEAKKLGAEKRPVSGALDHMKGDYSLGNILFDSKHTDGNSIIISGKDLTKITREANGEQKIPALVISVGRIPFSVPKEWVLIPLDAFSEMIDES